MDKIWETLTQPVYIIIYIAVMFVIMIFVIVSVMLNERRFNKMTEQIREDDKKAKESEEERNQKVEPESRFGMLKEYDEEKKARSPKVGYGQNVARLCVRRIYRKSFHDHSRTAYVEGAHRPSRLL